eukprot:scaffold98206_cov35-Prasinocladus_malaysianus.AAC.1
MSECKRVQVGIKVSELCGGRPVSVSVVGGLNPEIDISKKCVFLNELCGNNGGVSMCHLGFYLEGFFNVWSVWWSVILAGMIIVTPSFTWLPVVQEAINVSGKQKAQRLLQLPRPAAVAFSLTVISVLHSLRVDGSIPGVTAEEMSFHLFLSSGSATFATAVAVWVG